MADPSDEQFKATDEMQQEESHQMEQNTEESEVPSTFVTQHQSLFGTSVAEDEIRHPEEEPEAENVRIDQFEGSPRDVSSDVEELKKEKVHLEHALFLANEELDAMREKIFKIDDISNEQKKEVDILLRERNQRMATMRELECERDKILLAKNECEQRAEILMRQREDCEGKIDRLVHEKSLLTMDIQLLKNEKNKLEEKNFSLESTIDNLGKEKLIVQYEKERWAQEKEIYLHNKEWFMNEITERDRKFTALRIEMVRYTGELQAEISVLNDKYESSLSDVKRLSSSLTTNEEEISRLNLRIKEILEENVQKVNKLEEELLASERLSSVYKEASEDAEHNLRQLSDDFEARGKLLEESKNAYEIVCNQLSENHKIFKDEVNKKDHQICELEDELKKANELLKSGNRVSLSEDEILKLSPAAAAAAALMRGGVSLTGIYREHCRIIAQLEETKAEKDRVEKYFHELVEDIEEKAPLLVQERIKYESVAEQCINLQKQLKEADDERQKLENARNAALRELTYTRAELERFQRDCDDLSRQVRHLLHTLEVGKARDTDSPPVSEEDREILWSSIGELQRVNQKLMSDLHASKANYDRKVEEANSEEIKRLANSLDDAIKKLELLKSHNSKQNHVIEELQKQRDTYKSLCDAGKNREESIEKPSLVHNFETQVSSLRAQVERAEQSLELFRDEKHRSEEILQGRLEHQFALIAELRKTNGKLEGDVEFRKQTQLMLTKQTQGDANLLDSTKERCTKLEANLKTSESVCQKLQLELMETKAEVAKYKSNFESLMEQVSVLHSSEARLHQELQVLRESTYSNEKMSHTLQKLQNKLDHSDEQRMKQLEDQLAVSKNENDSLKKFVNEISEQHRVISLDLKMTSNKVATERDQALASKKSAEDRLLWKDQEYEHLKVKYEDLINQLNSSESSVDISTDGYKAEAQQLRNRNSYLENQLKDVSNRLEISEKTLAIREQELEDISKMSSNMESTLMEQSASAVAGRKSLQSMLNVMKEQLDHSVSTVDSQMYQIAALEQKIVDQTHKAEEDKVEAQKELAKLEKKNTTMEVLHATAEARLHELEAQIATLIDEKNASTEMVEQLRQELAKSEETITSMDNQLLAERAVISEVKEKLENLRSSSSAEISLVRAEKFSVEKNLTNSNEQLDECKQKLEELNVIMVKLSERTAFLERSGECSSEESIGSGKSASALYAVINYLQNESRQAMERTMNAELQWKRLKAQQASADEQRSSLEEEIRKLKCDTERQVRELAEKSEMMSRLKLLEGVKKDNENLRNQSETLTRRCEQLSKSVRELQTRVAQSDAEKLTEKGRLQNALSDFQNCRKELESWKERHSHALSAVGKFGPEKIVTLTSEIEAYKRKLNVTMAERDSLKKDVEKMSQELQGSSSRSVEISAEKGEYESLSQKHKDLAGRFEQARAFARQYRMKSHNLEKENATLKEQLDALSVLRDEQTEISEIATLRQELLAARSELEKQKQKAVPRVGWPVEQSTSSAGVKTTAILQAQLKQMELLNQQNKDLKNQLEELSSKLKQTVSRANEAESKLRSLQSESDSKDELRFRLSSITSLMTKKEQEVAQLRDQLYSSTQQLEEFQQRNKTLETMLSETRLKSVNPSISFDAPVSKSISSTTSVISQAGSVLVTSRSNTALTKTDSEQSGSHGIEVGMPLGASAATVTSVGVSEAESICESIPITSSAELLNKTPASTTDDQPLGFPSYSQFGSKEEGYSGTLTPKSKQAQHALDLSHTYPALFTENILSSSITPQSNTVSQSSIPTSLSGDVKPAQHNVISGSSDSANVITSSVAVEETVLTRKAILKDSVPSGNVLVQRKRIFAVSGDQASSVETESHTLQPQKRQRYSPTEQVSTSSRFLRPGRELCNVDEPLMTLDDEEAEQEQDSVETTTNPENKESHSSCFTTKAPTVLVSGKDDINEAGDQVKKTIEHIHPLVEQEERDDHDEYVHGRDVSIEEEDVMEEAEEALEEETDEDFDEEEFDDEDLMEIHSGGENDDIVVLDGDDSSSRSPADQSTDELQGVEHPAHMGEDMESSDNSQQQFPITEDIGGNNELELQRSSSEQPYYPTQVSSGEVEEYMSCNPEAGNSEALYQSPSKHMQSSSPNVMSQEGDVVSGSELLATHDSSIIANIESDSRGASSTVAPGSGTDVDGDDDEGGLQLVISGGESESGNEVAEEEQGDRHTTQTDDESGLSEPTTSDIGTGRRIRIRYPDIVEPTSSSGDLFPSRRGNVSRGSRFFRSRRGRSFRFK